MHQNPFSSGGPGWSLRRSPRPPSRLERGPGYPIPVPSPHFPFPQRRLGSQAPSIQIPDYATPVPPNISGINSGCFFWSRISRSVRFLPRNALLVHLRGLGIAYMSSVRLSVTLVDCDHIGWKSRKLIARTISPTPSLFEAERRYHLIPGEHGENLGRLEVG